MNFQCISAKLISECQYYEKIDSGENKIKVNCEKRVSRNNC